jgi:hypothetical protein
VRSSHAVGNYTEHSCLTETLENLHKDEIYYLYFAPDILRDEIKFWVSLASSSGWQSCKEVFIVRTVYKGKFYSYYCLYYYYYYYYLSSLYSIIDLYKALIGSKQDYASVAFYDFVLTDCNKQKTSKENLLIYVITLFQFGYLIIILHIDFSKFWSTLFWTATI